MDGLGLSAHLMGDTQLVLLVRMPPPRRPLEAHLVAMVIGPEPRYFTLGRPIGESPDSTLTTFREVTREGVNQRMGSGRTAEPSEFLGLIARASGLPGETVELNEEQVRASYPRWFPDEGPVGDDPLSALKLDESIADRPAKKPWWRIW
jgi:hypothetical protein